MFVTNLHGIAPNFGPEYHKLSELAHPTEQATRQSIAVVLEKNGLADAGANRWLELLRKDSCGLLMREIWLMDAIHERLTELPIRLDDLPNCNRAFSQFQEEMGRPTDS